MACIRARRKRTHTHSRRSARAGFRMELLIVGFVVFWEISHHLEFTTLPLRWGGQCLCEVVVHAQSSVLTRGRSGESICTRCANTSHIANNPMVLYKLANHITILVASLARRRSDVRGIAGTEPLSLCAATSLGAQNSLRSTPATRAGARARHCPPVRPPGGGAAPAATTTAYPCADRTSWGKSATGSQGRLASATADAVVPPSRAQSQVRLGGGRNKRPPQEESATRPPKIGGPGSGGGRAAQSPPSPTALPTHARPCGPSSPLRLQRSNAGLRQQQAHGSPPNGAYCCERQAEASPRPRHQAALRGRRKTYASSVTCRWCLATRSAPPRRLNFATSDGLRYAVEDLLSESCCRRSASSSSNYLNGCETIRSGDLYNNMVCAA